jgi:hypothetical protein
MFLAGEILMDLSFPVARAGLVRLAATGVLASASERAYGDGAAEMIRTGPRGAGAGIPGLAGVHYREAAASEESAVLALRWEAAGPAGRVFPAMDADLTLTAAGELASRLSAAAVFRPPPGGCGTGCDRASAGPAAAAAVRSLLSRIAAALSDPEAAACIAGGARVLQPGRPLAAAGPP